MFFLFMTLGKSVVSLANNLHSEVTLSGKSFMYVLGATTAKYILVE